jgi:chitinase
LAGHEQRLTALRSAHPSTPRKDIMDRQKILIEHWRWLQVNGTKQQAASCKRQALDLTRKNYNVIGVYRRKKYDDKIYESKRSN